MRFEQLKKTLLEVSSEESNGMITSYIDKRNAYLSNTIFRVAPKKSSKKGAKRGATVSMTKEQFELAKSLGLIL
jgi:hypothetical protein